MQLPSALLFIPAFAFSRLGVYAVFPRPLLISSFAHLDPKSHSVRRSADHLEPRA